MSGKVIITCPYYTEGVGGVATFYKVYAEKQTQNASLFYIGKDRPCGIIRTTLLLLGQYIKLFVIMPQYDLLVVNPSMMTNAIKRDTISVRIARFWKKKTCVFWRGFNEGFYENVAKNKYKKLLNRGLFKVDYSIVLGKNIYDKYHEIGLNTAYSLGSTMLDENLLRTSPKVFKKERFSILFLARIIKEKGIFESIQAFAKFHEMHDDTDMVIAGAGDDYDKVKAYIENCHIPDITLLGDVRGEKKKTCFENADIYLFPSYTEGMPNSVLEALGMGLPVITSNVGAVPDFFKNGTMGVLMQGHSCEEILAAMENLYQIRDGLSAISEFNRSYAAQNFVDKVVIKKMENIFNNICNDRKYY